MLDVRLTYPSPEGSREIIIDAAKTTFGRGSDAAFRFEDDGLSRLHASLYREGARVWIVDENSSNGTFLNGVQVVGAGTPLRNGDSIKIGNSTILNVRITEQAAPVNRFQPSPAASSVNSVESAEPAYSLASLLPVALIAIAFLVISISAVVMGYKLFFSGSGEVVQTSDTYDSGDDLDKPEKKSTPSTKPGGTNTNTPSSGNTAITDSPSGTSTTGPTVNVPSGKQYLSMSETEKRQYLADRAMKIAQVIGNNSSEAIPDAAIDKIKGFADGYAKRISVKPLGGCRFGDNLQVTYERASKNAPFIVKAFNEKGTDPRIGMYLAMIESEHCVCLQSPTGPLGMFQFTKSTGEIHGLKTVKGASPTNPDERCEPEPAARAAASYMKALTGRYGTGPSSVPLAIGSYNSGEGGLSSNLVKALESNTGLPRDFWTLISKGDILSKQFQSENFKYVPKFFAAAIIGENPQDFGLKLQPLSTYSR